jgi:hypothetical protein
VAVTHAGLGEQVAGTGRVVFELAAQLGHVEPQISHGPIIAQAAVPAR